MHAVPHRREPAQGGAGAAVDRVSRGHRSHQDAARAENRQAFLRDLDNVPHSTLDIAEIVNTSLSGRQNQDAPCLVKPARKRLALKPALMIWSGLADRRL